MRLVLVFRVVMFMSGAVLMLMSVVVHMLVAMSHVTVGVLMLMFMVMFMRVFLFMIFRLVCHCSSPCFHDNPGEGA